jgi:hypothetical protein
MFWVLVASAPVVACSRHGRPSTVADELDVSDGFILIGHVTNANKTDEGGTTDFVIGRAFKRHPALAGKKVVTLPRFIEIPDPKNTPRFIVFGAARDGKIDIYRGLPETPELVRYIEGILKLDTRDRVKLMRYAFDFLEPKGTEAANDALLMFAFAADADLRTVGEKLDPVQLRKWLAAKDQRQPRSGLYGHLLGHCGKPEDAALLRKLLDDSNDNFSAELLVGYVLLDKKAGYEYLMKRIADEDEEFLVKHAGLKALRYFWNSQPAVLTKEQVLAGMVALMTHPDMADMPIDDLRRWKVWKLSPQVLHLATLEAHSQQAINRRAVLKFAIAASQADPKNKAAVDFVAQARKDDPLRTNLLEDLLKDEAEALKPAVAPLPRARE